MQLPVTRTTIQVRYSDTDAMGHISSGSYIAFMEVGRLDLFREILRLTGVDLLTVLARITIDYVSEARFDDHIEVMTWVERVGTRSLTIGQRVLANDQPAATGTVVNVAFDSATRSSVPLPAGWQASVTPEA